jgi:hypothetical protein
MNPRFSSRVPSSATVTFVGTLVTALAASACSSAPSSDSRGSAEQNPASLSVTSAASEALCRRGGKAHLFTTGSDATIQIVNPTADDRFVIYTQSTTDDAGTTTTALNALPLDGGAPRMIAADVSGGVVIVDQSTVFLWTNVSDAFVGELTVWTESTGARLASTASVAYFSAASPDSRSIVFSTAVNAAGTFGDLVAASPAHPERQTKLVADTTLFGNASFVPSLVFQPSGTPNPSSPGFVNDAYFVTTHEEEGSSTVTLSSWDSATWQRRDLVVGAATDTQLALQNWNADARGEHIAALTTGGQLEVVPVAGPAEAAWRVGPAGGTSTFALQEDGEGIVFGNPPAPAEVAPSTPLFTARRRDPRPEEVVSSGFGGVYFPWENGVLGLTPDSRHVLYFSTESSAFGFLYSLDLVANAPSSTPVTIDSSLTATIPADPFTTDSRYVIYLASFSTTTFLGELRVWDIERERALTVTGPTAVTANAIGGSRVLYNDDYDGTTGGPSGAADLKMVDVGARSLQPTTIQAGADAIYYLTPDRSRVVYTVTGATAAADDGIYVYTF